MQDKELPHEIFRTTRQKKRNAFTKNMLMDIKLNKHQLSKIIQSDGFISKTLGNIMSNVGKNASLDLAVPLVKHV